MPTGQLTLNSKSLKGFQAAKKLMIQQFYTYSKSRVKKVHLQKSWHQTIPDPLDNGLVYSAAAHVLCSCCKYLGDAPNARVPFVILHGPLEVLRAWKFKASDYCHSQPGMAA